MLWDLLQNLYHPECTVQGAHDISIMIDCSKDSLNFCIIIIIIAIIYCCQLFLRPDPVKCSRSRCRWFLHLCYFYSSFVKFIFCPFNSHYSNAFINIYTEVWNRKGTCGGGSLFPHPWSWNLFYATSEEQLFAPNESTGNKERAVWERCFNWQPPPVPGQISDSVVVLKLVWPLSQRAARWQVL